jgi:HAD superfamily hydrolase (TIGR01549 family)
MTKAIFFDWDGTLVDSLPMLFEAHNHVREKLGYPLWSRDEYAQAIVYSTRELYPRLYGERSEEARGVLTDFIKDNHLSRIKVMEGVIELLDELSEQDVIMGIVSNKTHEILGIEVKHLGWDKYFGIYNGAGVAALDKPSGVPLMHALAMHPAKPAIENVIYVGDMESDLSCAREAGCPVVFIRGTARSEELIETYKPEYIVDNISELKESLIDFLSKPTKKKA